MLFDFKTAEACYNHTGETDNILFKIEDSYHSEDCSESDQWFLTSDTHYHVSVDEIQYKAVRYVE